MRLYLTPLEKKNLKTFNSLTVERMPYLSNTHKKNIIHGIGTQTLFNKIEYHWVFGNCDEYIEKMKNVGRRVEDYPDNKGNIWNGSKWWNCFRDSNEFAKIGDIVTNGRKNIIRFKVEDIFISELRPHPELELYNQIIFKINITLV